CDGYRVGTVISEGLPRAGAQRAVDGPRAGNIRRPHEGSGPRAVLADVERDVLPVRETSRQRGTANVARQRDREDLNRRGRYGEGGRGTEGSSCIDRPRSAPAPASPGRPIHLHTIAGTAADESRNAAGDLNGPSASRSGSRCSRSSCWTCRSGGSS